MLQCHDFILARCAGEFASDYATATLNGIAFDSVKKDYDDDMLNEIGLDRMIITLHLPCDSIAGRSAARAELRIEYGSPVLAGTVDTGSVCCSQRGHPGRELFLDHGYSHLPGGGA